MSLTTDQELIASYQSLLKEKVEHILKDMTNFINRNPENCLLAIEANIQIRKLLTEILVKDVVIKKIDDRFNVDPYIDDIECIEKIAMPYRLFMFVE
jgi:hypothetical protein